MAILTDKDSDKKKWWKRNRIANYINLSCLLFLFAAVHPVQLPFPFFLFSFDLCFVLSLSFSHLHYSAFLCSSLLWTKSGVGPPSAEGNEPMKHCVEQVRRKRNTLCFFCGMVLNPGKTRHIRRTLQFEIWNWLYNWTRDATAHLALLLTNCKPLWCSWNESNIISTNSKVLRCWLAGLLG